MTGQTQRSSLLGKIAAYTEILVKDPKSTIFVSLAEAYRKMGMFDDVRQIISKGLELHQDFSPAYIVLARVLCQSEDFDGSIVAFERALKLDDENLAALVGCARVKILRGQAVEARELLLRARHLSPADPVINKLLLSLPAEPESVEEQSAEKHELSDEHEVSSASLVSPTLADLYLQQGLTQEALNIYRQLSVQNPNDLIFRRKVKELEKHSREEENLNINKESIVVPLPQQEDVPSVSEESIVEQDIFVGDTQEQNETLTGKAVSEADSMFTDEPVLKILNQWLSNIRQRREDV
jgi:tetratricopeptide (TPR) repeat protein